MSACIGDCDGICCCVEWDDDRAPKRPRIVRIPRDYEFDCLGTLEAIRYACQPRNEDPAFPLTQYVPYYGKPVDVAVWRAVQLMKHARRIGLLHEDQYQLRARLRARASRRRQVA